MERGSKKELQASQITMPPGLAYVLMGAAQGCTKVCEKRCVGHNRCNCCWTHGVLLAEKSVVARQSMTIRVLAGHDASESEGEVDAVAHDSARGVGAPPAAAMA